MRPSWILPQVWTRKEPIDGRNVGVLDPPGRKETRDRKLNLQLAAVIQDGDESKELIRTRRLRESWNTPANPQKPVYSSANKNSLQLFHMLFQEGGRSVGSDQDEGQAEVRE